MKNPRINFLLTLLILALFACDKKKNEDPNPYPDTRDQVVGTYRVQEDEVNGTSLPPYTITITKAETTATTRYVTIQNIANSGKNVKASVIQNAIAATAIPITAQIHGITNPSLTIIGSFNATTLNFQYTIEAGGKMEAVNVVATKTGK